MKKIVLILLIPFLLLYANTEFDNNYLKKYIEREKELISYIQNYIYNTGDYVVNRNKISQYYQLKSAFFTNLNNEKCTETAGYCDNVSDGINFSLDNTSYTLTLTNHLSKNLATFPQNVLNTYKKSPFLPNTFMLNNTSMSIVMDTPFIKFMTTLKDLQSYGTYIGTTTPTNVNDFTWVKPEGNGVLSVYLKDLDGNWFYGTSLNKDVLNYEIMIPSTTNIDIQKFVLPDSSKISIINPDNSLKSYISKTKIWYLIGSNSSDTNTTTPTTSTMSDISLYNIACVDFDKESGYKANVGIEDSYILAEQEFIKSDTPVKHWNSNHYWVVNSYSNLNTLSTTQTHVGYICSQNSFYYDKLMFLNGNWNFMVNSFSSLFKYDNYVSSSLYVSSWDGVSDTLSDYQRLFKGEVTVNGVIWKSTHLYNETLTFTPNTKYQISSSSKSRDVFTSIDANTIYLTVTNDCPTKANCNGASNYAHSGWMIDGLYAWISDGTNLIDAFPIDSPLDMYDGEYQHKGAYSFNNKIYIKTLDANGNIAYKEKGTNNFITANNQIIPSAYLNGSNIPMFPKKVLTDTKTTNDIDIQSSNVLFNNLGIMQLSDKLQLSLWKDSNGLQVNLVGTTGNYVLTINGSYSYWHNTTTKEYITDGTRDALPSINDTTYKILTTQIGCERNSITDSEKECRYNSNGIKDSVDTDFYKWYVASTVKSVNQLVDLKVYTSIEEVYQDKVDIAKVIDTGKEYMKILDVNGNVCYQELNNPLNILTKNNQIVPSNYITSTGNVVNTISLPPSKTCDTILYKDNKIIFKDRYDLLTWTNAIQNQEAYLLINNLTYSAKQNSSLQVYFESVEANEKLSPTNKFVFEGVSYTGLKTKYITKNIDSTYNFNNTFQIKNHLSGYFIVAGDFSTDDGNLYVWYENPTIYNDKLVDMVTTNDIKLIYNQEHGYSVYDDSNTGTFQLLEKDTINNAICYVNKRQIPYNYILKETGIRSLTDNNLPTTKNCTNAQFYNGSLVVNTMETAVDNWDYALNGYSVILSDFQDKNKFILRKYGTQIYWANNINLNIGLVNGEPNRVYAKNRSAIGLVPSTNTTIKVYTTNITGEQTNLNMGNKDFFEFTSNMNVDASVRSYINVTNGVTDKFIPNNINLYAFDNINGVTGGTGDNVQIVPKMCKLIVDGYWDYLYGNGGTTPRSAYTQNGYGNWKDLTYIPQDNILFTYNNKLYVNHNFKYKDNGGATSVPSSFVAVVDTSNNVAQMNSIEVSSFLTTSYGRLNNSYHIHGGELYWKTDTTTCISGVCTPVYKNLNIKTDNTVNIAQGYSTTSTYNVTTPIHNSDWYEGIDYLGYHFLSSSNVSPSTTYTGGPGAELFYHSNTSTISQLYDLYTGAGATKPNSSFVDDFIVYKNIVYFTAYYNQSGYKSLMYYNLGVGAGFLYQGNTTIYVVDVLGIINNKMIFVIKTTSDGKFNLYSYDGSAFGFIGSYISLTSLRKPSMANEVTINNNLLFFQCNNGTAGNELCYTNGTAAGVLDVTAGSTSTTFEGIVSNGTKIYFGKVSDKKIYSFDGTTTTMVNDTFVAKNSNTFFKNPYVFNSKIYFTRNNECGPYLINGTPTTTGHQWDVLHYLIP